MIEITHCNLAIMRARKEKNLQLSHMRKGDCGQT